MGIQISFERKDAASLISDEVGHTASCGECDRCMEDMQGCDRPYKWTVVQLRDDEAEIWVNAHEQTLWCDANHWGTNRGIIIPMLERHGVEFTES
jgi:hypothetical protein